MVASCPRPISRRQKSASCPRHRIPPPLSFSQSKDSDGICPSFVISFTKFGVLIPAERLSLCQWLDCIHIYYIQVFSPPQFTYQISIMCNLSVLQCLLSFKFQHFTQPKWTRVFQMLVMYKQGKACQFEHQKLTRSRYFPTWNRLSSEHFILSSPESKWTWSVVWISLIWWSYPITFILLQMVRELQVDQSFRDFKKSDHPILFIRLQGVRQLDQLSEYL